MAMDYQDDVSDLIKMEEQKQKSFFFFSTLALALTVGIFGILAGFVYGDYYGRKHAQFNNVDLRKHYAGQCYSYIDSTLKKSIQNALDKSSGKKDQLDRLDEIKSRLINLQLDMEQFSSGANRKGRPREKDKDRGPSPMKKKVASTS